MWQVGVQGCPWCAWHGSMPGNHAQVGLIRLFCGLSRAARTTFSLNAWSYVVRFFLVREPGDDEVGVGIGPSLCSGMFRLRGPSTHFVHSKVLAARTHTSSLTYFKFLG